MTNSIWGVLVLIVALVFLVPAVSGAYTDTTSTQERINESVTIQYDEPIPVDGRGVSYYDNETVKDDGGNILTEGTDYTWNTDTGELTWLNTTATTEGQVGTITYTYEGAQGRNDYLTTIIGPLTFAFPFLLVLGAGATALKLASEFGGGY